MPKTLISASGVPPYRPEESAVVHPPPTIDPAAIVTIDICV